MATGDVQRAETVQSALATTGAPNVEKTASDVLLACFQVNGDENTITTSRHWMMGVSETIPLPPPLRTDDWVPSAKEAAAWQSATLILAETQDREGDIKLFGGSFVGALLGFALGRAVANDVVAALVAIAGLIALLAVITASKPLRSQANNLRAIAALWPESGV